MIEYLTRKYKQEYRIWSGMKSRCYNVNNPGYKNYGGRGIKVCERWLEKGTGFKNFFADMGMRPSKEYSIDRIDNDGDYSQENCRWATKKEQVLNTRRNVRYEWNGNLYTLSEIEDITGINRTTLKSRLKSGTDIDTAIKQKTQIKADFEYLISNKIKFGRIHILEVLYRVDTVTFVLGECECGTVKQFRYGLLSSGHTKSCGCFKTEMDVQKLLKFKETLKSNEI
jgi:hypothetical protein